MVIAGGASAWLMRYAHTTVTRPAHLVDSVSVMTLVDAIARPRWGWATTTVAAILPVVFAGGAVATNMRVTEWAPQSVVAEVSALWTVVVLLGVFVVVPALCLLLVGSALVWFQPVAGRAVIITSLVVMTGVWAMAMLGGALHALGDPAPPTERELGGDILPRLDAGGVAIYMTPLIVMVGVNAAAMRALFAAPQNSRKAFFQ